MLPFVCVCVCVCVVLVRGGLGGSPRGAGTHPIMRATRSAKPAVSRIVPGPSWNLSLSTHAELPPVASAESFLRQARPWQRRPAVWRPSVWDDTFSPWLHCAGRQTRAGSDAEILSRGRRRTLAILAILAIIATMIAIIAIMVIIAIICMML